MVEIAPVSILPPWRPASPPGPSHTALPRDPYRGTRWLAPYGPHIPHQWNHGFIGKYWIMALIYLISGIMGLLVSTG